MPPQETLGFLGLGIMGYPMAENLLRAGHPVIVWNRTGAKAEPLRQRGAAVADTPEEVGRRAQIIFMCLGDTAAAEEVCDRLLRGVQSGS
ncbi:MAG TPA: NAD(P)-binding domain-containing protein, partial [Terriglobia bacterium]|nr:NAD(P)-binding domain-containing protein [Terriglobia bacterium]